MKDFIILLRFAGLVVASVLLSNCATNSVPADKTAAVEQQSDETAGAQPISAAAFDRSNAASQDYRILPRDVLEVSVFQVPDLNKTVRVSEDGNVTLPLIGKAKVAGSTTHEAEQMITSGLRKKYMQSPQVSVSVKQFGQKVTVSGAVKSPHVLTVDGALTLSQAIALAGGLGETANASRIHIARMVGRRVQDDTYNLDAIQAGKLADPALQAGDIVVAEESGARVAFKNLKDILPFAVLASVL